MNWNMPSAASVAPASLMTAQSRPYDTCPHRGTNSTDGTDGDVTTILVLSTIRPSAVCCAVACSGPGMHPTAALTVSSNGIPCQHCFPPLAPHSDPTLSFMNIPFSLSLETKSECRVERGPADSHRLLVRTHT
jgi:hypothetical protein